MPPTPRNLGGLSFMIETVATQMHDADSLRSSARVELLTLYSNHADQVRKLQRLLELPLRPAGEPPRCPVDIRRQPTKAEWDEIVIGYQAGATLQELATQFGMHRETISAALERAGVKRRYHQTVAVDLGRAAELVTAGLTITETADALGIGRTTLVKARRTQRTQAAVS